LIVGFIGQVLVTKCWQFNIKLEMTFPVNEKISISSTKFCGT